jgi:hypothetical protein
MKDKFEISVKKAVDKNGTFLQNKEIVWKGIEQKMQKSKVRRLYFRLSIAASILIIAGIGTLIISANRNSKVINDYYCEVSAELSQTEFYFAQMIEQKRKEVDNESIPDKKYFDPFFDEIDRLDKQYEEYKKELAKFGYQEELIRAIILNRQQQLDVLNRLLTEIKKVKNYENRKKSYSI